MNYSGLYFYDTQNCQDGFSVTLFVSGCKRRLCKHCHNKQAWDFNYGKKFTKEVEEEIFDNMSQPCISAFSILGGEPLDNLSGGELLNLVVKIKEKHPNKLIYCWTGYTYEEAIKDETKKAFIEKLDYLIDGEYIHERKNLNLGYAGSDNQRKINIKETIMKGEIVVWRKE